MRSFCSFPYSFLFITASLEDCLSFGEVGNEAPCEQRGITLYLTTRKPIASFDFSTGESLLRRNWNSGQLENLVIVMENVTFC